MNTISVSDWSAYEAAGAVFLPAAGYRLGTDVDKPGSLGNYWSSTPGGEEYASIVPFYLSYLFPKDYGLRSSCRSVRLVHAAPKDATALSNTPADTKAEKRIVDGQLFILRDGKTYNAIGVEVR